MTCTKIRTKLLYPKLHYFLSAAGLGTFWPHIAVYGGQLGIPVVGIGIIFSVAPAIGMIANPVFGAIADRFKAKKKLFLAFNLVMVVFLSGFRFLPQTQVTRHVALECKHNLNSNDTQYESYITYNATKDQNQCNSNQESLSETNNSSVILISSETCRLNCILSSTESEIFCATYFNSTNQPRICNGEELPTSISLELNVNPTKEEHSSNATFYNVDFQNINISEKDIIYNKESFFSSCGKLSAFPNCFIDCNQNPNFNKNFEKVETTVDEEFHKSKIFWLYAMLIIFCWIAFTVVNSVGDTLTFQTLGDDCHLYGQQRQWGSVGWGICSLLSGYLIDYFSGDSVLKDYTPSFYILGILLALNFIVCCLWPVVEQPKPESLTKNIVGLMMNPKIFVFILACIVVGFCSGLLWQFIFWYAESLATCEQKKRIKLLQGLINFVQCFGGEIPFFYMSSWFIRKLGHVHCMTLVLGAFGLRFLIYSVLTNPWHILPVELLQGICFGIFWSTMASYAYVVSPEGSAATVQGIVSAAFKGIGIGGGSLVGGILFKTLSGRMAFRIFGVASLAFCLLHHGVMYFLLHNFSPVSQVPDNGDISLKMTETKDGSKGDKQITPTQ